ncbi:hypothetical protein A8135_12050 [Legionella jamestowniensis]|uniref:Transporter, permease n=1 Tax=Legionella jamestowniensis TaxID=455 RepID=A0ABX2XUG7_9GAMM|nr:AI-2E family transporter [Legionella jamestowniensis]OCH98284.1 hypothetical protein A8135_12050 [Legionella jamestowniensis]
MMGLVESYFYLIGSLLLTGYLISVSSSLLNPLLAAIILALALKPMSSKFEQLKIPRLISALLSVLVCIFILLGIVAFFSSQVSNINFELDSLGNSFDGILGKSQTWISEVMGISAAQQTSMLNESFNTLIKNSTAIINSTLSMTTSFITSFILFIISLFFFLYYRRKLVIFLFKITKSKHHSRLKNGLKKIQSVVSSYVLGLSFVIFIIAVLNTIGLWILGIEHALLFGVMAAVLTLIPYVGILIGSFFPALYTLIQTGSLWLTLGVILIFAIVQFIEGNFLTPNIVGRQVRVNPFAAILALVIGGLVLGIIGIMFALPVLALVKVICDEIPPLQPIGFLIE